MRRSLAALLPLLVLLVPAVSAVGTAVASPGPVDELALVDRLAAHWDTEGLAAAELPWADAAAAGERRVLLLALDAWPVLPAQALALERLGVVELERFDVSRTLRASVPDEVAPYLHRLHFVAGVTGEEPIEELLSSSKRAIGLTAELHRAGFDGSGVTIALVDTGIDETHPALRERVLLDLAVGPNGVARTAPGTSEHGTHVAGVLVGTGAGAPAGSDLSGVAPGAQLVSLDLSTQFTTSNALRAFEWIYRNHDEHDIRIVSNSWGRQRDPAVFDADDPLIRASDALVAEGLVVIFSSGNGGDTPGRMTLEATNPNVITVGAVTDAGRVESYSSRGPVLDGDQRASWTKPDLVAPGSRILSTRSEGGPGAWYLTMNGTSMAAPHAAGAAAVLLSARSDLTPGQIKGLLVTSARDLGPSGPDDETGYGLLDVQAALRSLEAAGDQVVTQETKVRRQGELTGTTRLGSVLPALGRGGVDSFTFEVPANTTVIDAKLAWTGQGPLKVQLRDPIGSTKEDTVPDGGTLRVERPLPGVWRMALEPADVDRGTYDAELTLMWTEAAPGLAVPEVDVTTQRGAFPFSGHSNPFAPTFLPGVPLFVPMLAGGLLTLLLVAGSLKRRRRKARERRAIEVEWAYTETV